MWWLSMTPPVGVPSEMARDFQEALACHAAGHHYAAALVARRVLQAAARDVIGRPGANLASEINAIPLTRLSQVLKDAAHEVRYIGNDAAHANTIDPDDVGHLVVFTEQLLDALYVMPAKVAAARAKRTGRETAVRGEPAIGADLDLAPATPCLPLHQLGGGSYKPPPSLQRRSSAAATCRAPTAAIAAVAATAAANSSGSRGRRRAPPRARRRRRSLPIGGDRDHGSDRDRGGERVQVARGGRGAVGSRPSASRSRGRRRGPRRAPRRPGRRTLARGRRRARGPRRARRRRPAARGLAELRRGADRVQVGGELVACCRPVGRWLLTILEPR